MHSEPLSIKLNSAEVEEQIGYNIMQLLLHLTSLYLYMWIIYALYILLLVLMQYTGFSCLAIIFSILIQGIKYF